MLLVVILMKIVSFKQVEIVHIIRLSALLNFPVALVASQYVGLLNQIALRYNLFVNVWDTCFVSQ